MKIQNLPSEIADIARHALDGVEDRGEALAEKGAETLSSMSSMFNRSAKGMHTVRNAVLAYTSLRALAAAIDGVGPGRWVLGSMGLQRRPGMLTRTVTGVGIFAAGAAVGAGAALLLAPRAGAKTRAQIAKGFRSMVRDAEGVVDEVEHAAQDAVSSVEGTARNAAHEVSAAVRSVTGDGKAATSTPSEEHANHARAHKTARPHRAP